MTSPRRDMENSIVLDAFKEEFLTMLRQQQEGHEEKIARMLDEHVNRISLVMSGMHDGSHQKSFCVSDETVEPPKPDSYHQSKTNGSEMNSEEQRVSLLSQQVEAMHSPLRPVEAMPSITRHVSEDSLATDAKPPANRFASVNSRTILTRLVGRQSWGSMGTSSVPTLAQFLKKGTPVHKRNLFSDVPQPRAVHPCFEHIAKSWLFEALSVVAVLGNAFFVGLEADWVIRHQEEEAPVTFSVMEVLFTVGFTSELLIRFLAVGKWFASWQNPEVNWNAFDAILVLSSLLEIPLVLLVGSFVDLTATRLLRMMRLVRMLRMVRLLRSFKQLRIVVHSVAASLKPLLWALILLFAVIYLCSVVILQLVQGTAQANEEHIQKLYGSLLRAQYTLFACVTGGYDWEQVAEPLVTVSPFFSVFFILYISFSFFCIVNIVTGIFVENAKAMTQKDDEMILMEEAANRQEKLQEIKDLFELADTDGSRDLTEDEVAERLQDLRVQVLLQNLDIDILSVNPRGLFNSLDFDDSGTITIEEFADGLMRFRGNARSIESAELRHFMLQCLRGIGKCNEFLESHLSVDKRTGTFSKVVPKEAHLHQPCAEPVKPLNQLNSVPELY